jgi:hypothetical protein
MDNISDFLKGKFMMEMFINFVTVGQMGWGQIYYVIENSSLSTQGLKDV